MKNNIQRKSAICAYVLSVVFIVNLACSGTTVATVTKKQETSPQNPKTEIPAIVSTDTILIPTNTIIAPTNTPELSIIQPGTYLIGTDIKPGYYKGMAGYGILESCYWARLKDVSGSFESILANDNSIGQFYIHILDSDYALESKCSITYLESLPKPLAEYPTKIMPGTYLISIDILSGTYKGQAGADIMDSCYWARLQDVTGEFDSIIANDNAVGQFYVQLQQNDFAFMTKCELERVSE